MDALNLPSSYIIIWLFFKLPLLSFIGIALFPFTEKKIFSKPIKSKNKGYIVPNNIVKVAVTNNILFKRKKVSFETKLNLFLSLIWDAFKK